MHVGSSGVIYTRVYVTRRHTRLSLYIIHVLMRGERRKEERSKQDQTNSKTKQHSTHVHC